MKLLGRTDGKTIVASMLHHDYRSDGNLMMDGGQPLTYQYACYNRFSSEGECVWFEVPQSFDEHYEDYQFNGGKKENTVFGTMKMLKQIRTCFLMQDCTTKEWELQYCQAKRR